MAGVVGGEVRLLTSESALMFQMSIRPAPSALAKRAGCTGDHLTSYTYSVLFSNEARGLPVFCWRAERARGVDEKQEGGEDMTAYSDLLLAEELVAPELDRPVEGGGEEEVGEVHLQQDGH